MRLFISSSRVGRSLAAALVTGGLVAGGLSISPTASAAPDRPTAAKEGADWLAGQSTNGVYNFGFADYGLSIDAGIALKSVGGEKLALRKIKRALAANINGYIAGDAFGDVGSTYAGPTGKAASFVGRVGADPTNFGGVDLIDRLLGTVSTTAPIAGRIQDQSNFGDFANVIGQGFAVEALLREKPTKAKKPLAFLLKQQCAAGFFRLGFTPDATAADQTCDGGTAAESAADTDVTALVVLSLQASGTTNTKVTKALERANNWLAKRQAKNGSFGGGPSTEGANTNSTGLAGWALANSGNEQAARKAAAWIRRVQAFSPKACKTALTTDRGAIGYDRASYKAGLLDGVLLDQWVRATSQAVAVLAWSKTTVGPPKLRARKRVVEEGGTVRLKVSNLEPGERVCVSSAAGGVSYLSKKGRNHTIELATPSGTGRVTYRLKSIDGTSKVVVVVRAAA